MRSLLLFTLFLIYFLSSSAQTKLKSSFSGFNGSLSGRILDSASGAGLAGASVYIADLKLGALADATGNYKFANLPTGTYLVEAHAIGHSTQIKNITVSMGAVLDFNLGLQYTEESPVVVTGLSKATQIKRSPIPIVTMSHAAIVGNLSTNIIDAITRLPGVTELTTGPNVSKPFIRGLGYNRILTLYDGVRQEGQQWGDEHGIEVDQYGVDRAEVIKGPASLSYGSDALAGVVNLIPTPPAAEGKIQGDVLAEFQSNNGLFGGSGMLEGTKNGFEWMGRLSHKEASNYSNPVDGRVYNTAFDENDATVSLGLHRAFGYSHLNMSLFDDLQEIPDGSRDSATRQFTKQITDSDTFRPIVTNAELHSYAMTPLHQHVQLYHIYSTNNFVMGSGRLTVNLGFERSVRREYSHPQQPTIPGLFLQLNSYVYDLKYYLPTVNGWELTTGINGMYQQNTSTNGTEFIIPSFHQFDIGPFAMLKKPSINWISPGESAMIQEHLQISRCIPPQILSTDWICRFMEKIRQAPISRFRTIIKYFPDFQEAWALPTRSLPSGRPRQILREDTGRRIFLKYLQTVCIPVQEYFRLAIRILILNSMFRKTWV